MKNLLIHITFLLALLIGFTSCKSTQKTATTKDEQVSPYELTNIFLGAKRDLLKGKRSSALDGFAKCISLEPNHDASYYEMARIYEYENPNKSIELISKAASIDPNNIWYKEFQIRLYKDQREYDKALAVNKELIKLQPENKNYYYQRANLYIYKKDNKNAGKTYDKIIELFGYEQGVLDQQKQIYLSNGEYKKALVVLKELIAHNPKNKSYYGMVAEIYLSQGDTESAMEYYKKILAIDPNDGYVHFALADFYSSKGEKQESFEELKKGMAEPSLDIDSKMKVLVQLQNVAKADSSITPYFEELLLIATKVHPKEPKILAVNADYNFNNGETELAIDYYKRILAVDSSKFVIWEQLLIVANNISDTEDLLNYSERAIHLFPQQASLYFYNAVANADLGNWKEVKFKAKMGSNFLYKKTEKAVMLSLRAKAEMHLGEIDDAVANYNTALMLDPENIDIVRDYAYCLALNKRDMSRAIAMAKKALEIDNDNPYSVYVYAYSLYQNGQKEEANKWVKPALIKYPNNKQIQLLDMEINKS